MYLNTRGFTQPGREEAGVPSVSPLPIEAESTVARDALRAEHHREVGGGPARVAGAAVGTRRLVHSSDQSRCAWSKVIDGHCGFGNTSFGEGLHQPRVVSSGLRLGVASAINRTFKPFSVLLA